MLEPSFTIPKFIYLRQLAVLIPTTVSSLRLHGISVARLIDLKLNPQLRSHDQTTANATKTVNDIAVTANPN